jgi:hypothetical protein
MPMFMRNIAATLNLQKNKWIKLIRYKAKPQMNVGVLLQLV